MDVGSRAEFFVLHRLVVVDDQSDCPDVDASSDYFCPQEDLDLFVFQFGDSGCLRGRAVIWMEVVSALDANRSAVSMDVVHFQVVFS